MGMPILRMGNVASTRKIYKRCKAGIVMDRYQFATKNKTTCLLSVLLYKKHSPVKLVWNQLVVCPALDWRRKIWNFESGLVFRCLLCGSMLIQRLKCKIVILIPNTSKFQLLSSHQILHIMHIQDILCSLDIYVHVSTRCTSPSCH